jgi:hypothetical protein
MNGLHEWLVNVYLRCYHSSVTGLPVAPPAGTRDLRTCMSWSLPPIPHAPEKASFWAHQLATAAQLTERSCASSGRGASSPKDSSEAE